MKQIFLTDGSSLAPRWAEAFPAAEFVAPASAGAVTGAGQALLWLDGSGLEPGEPLEQALREALALSPRVVVMRPKPRESEAFGLLSAGASGYCHVAATPRQLREIADAIGAGAVWMPPELLRRIVSLSRRVVRSGPASIPGAAALTEKEFAVASNVARGASNREIAEALNVSERTVKSHLSSIFRKMDVRDRVQLALVMNNIPVSPSVGVN